MRAFSRLLTLGVLFTSASFAKADTYEVFNLSAILDVGDATGTVTLDQTTNAFTSANILANGMSFYGPPNLVDQESTYLRVHFGLNGDTNPADTAFGVDLPVSTLVGYQGGALCSETVQCGVFSAIGQQSNVATDPAVSGSLTVTPEPSSLALVGTGLLGVVGAIRRRINR